MYGYINIPYTILLTIKLILLTVFCQDGDVRLRGGLSLNEGLVEVCFGKMWGTVSDDGWSIPDAEVVCRQLNYAALLGKIILNINVHIN